MTSIGQLALVPALMLDPSRRVVTLAGDLPGISGLRLTVAPETPIEQAGRPVGLQDLREGMRVEVAYEQRPLEKVARLIRVTGPARAAGRSE
jgi:hypothetical protein